MTEPSPSPIPTTSSGPSWLDSLGPLNHLWQEQSFVVFVITALVLPLASWLGKQAWKTWKRKRHAQRVAARRQQLPSVRLPFTVEVGNQRLTLEPAQPQQNFAPEGMSIVRLLSARSTPVPFLDRAGALTRLETWARSEERFAIHVLGGDGGSGKTRLGVELCRRLTTPNTHGRGAEVWQAGFLQNIEQSDNTSSSDDASSLLLVVDYAEARPEVVTEVIKIALRTAEDPERRRVRIVFLVRRPSPLSSTRQGSNEWIDALRPQESKDEGANLILDTASAITLNNEELADTERRSLLTQAYRSFTNTPNSLPAPDLLERLGDPTYSQPLLLIIEAFLNTLPKSDPQHSDSPGELFEEILLHEENYWHSHWPEGIAFDAKLARQVVAAATLVDICDEADAITLLDLLPSHFGNNAKELTQWLRDCYPPHIDGSGHSALWCAHLEPDRIGEHLVVSEADNLEPLLRELMSPRRVGTSSIRTWTVLERTSTDPHLNENVGRILNDMLVEVTQTVHAQTVNSQSPDLAAAFAKLFSAVRSHIEPDEAHEAEQSLSNAGYLTIFLECELAQRAADITPPTDESPEIDRATYASRILSLSRCLAASGRRDEALKTAQEATNLYRTLAEHNPAAHTPNLATSLNNLAIYLDRSGQQREALQTAQEAVTIRRKLAEHNPAAHTPNLTRSLNTYADILERSGNTKEAARIRQERDEVLKRMKEMEEGEA